MIPVLILDGEWVADITPPTRRHPPRAWSWRIRRHVRRGPCRVECLAEGVAPSAVSAMREVHAAFREYHAFRDAASTAAPRKDRAMKYFNGCWHREADNPSPECVTACGLAESEIDYAQEWTDDTILHDTPGGVPCPVCYPEPRIADSE